MAIALIYITNINAQTVHLANTPDISAAQNVNGIQNTGNYSILFESSYFQVMCWDGNSPGIGWGKGSTPEQYFAFDGTNIGAIEDPDVALYEINNTLYAFFIYLVDNNVYYEIWSYSASNWSINTNATQIGSSSNTSYCPNVDIDDQNHLAAVWQDGYNIILITGTIQSVGAMYTIQTGTSTLNYESPDVSVFHDYTNTYTNINVTCLIKGTNEYFNIDYYDYSNPLTINGSHFSLQLNSSYTYGKPRIAAPVHPTIFDYKDFSAVLSQFDGSKYQLLSITRFNAKNSPLMHANTYPDISSSISTEPAITYINEDILIAFKTNYNNPDYEIFQKKLNYKGDINIYNYYSQVNISTNGDQTTPSISGRYAPQNNAFYTFFDDDTDDILYKNSNVGNQNLRIQNETNNALIYPNPASGSFTLNIMDVSEGSNITICDIQGRTLLQQDIDKSKTIVDISSLSQGTYFIKILNHDHIIIKCIIVK